MTKNLLRLTLAAGWLLCFAASAAPANPAAPTPNPALTKGRPVTVLNAPRLVNGAQASRLARDDKNFLLCATGPQAEACVPIVSLASMEGIAVSIVVADDNTQSLMFDRSKAPNADVVAQARAVGQFMARFNYVAARLASGQAGANGCYDPDGGDGPADDLRAGRPHAARAPRSNALCGATGLGDPEPESEPGDGAPPPPPPATDGEPIATVIVPGIRPDPGAPDPDPIVIPLPPNSGFPPPDGSEQPEPQAMPETCKLIGPYVWKCPFPVPPDPGRIPSPSDPAPSLPPFPWAPDWCQLIGYCPAKHSDGMDQPIQTPAQMSCAKKYIAEATYCDEVVKPHQGLEAAVACGEKAQRKYKACMATFAP